MTEQVKLLRFVVGPVCTNCYLLINQERQELLIIDPGEQEDLLERQITKSGATPVAILLTHGHFDHATAAAALKEKYQIPVYAHEMEQETLENPSLNLCGMVGEHHIDHADVYLKDEQVI